MSSSLEILVKAHRKAVDRAFAIYRWQLAALYLLPPIILLVVIGLLRSPS